MTIPEINNWVACRDRDDGPGKVIAVDEEGKKFRAIFLTEPFYSEPSSLEESDWLDFSEIEFIIDDPAEIKELESEFNYFEI